MTELPSGAEELTAAVRKLVGQVSHWTPSRWAASGASSSASSGGRSGARSGVSAGAPRADVVHELVQWLADRAAEAEGEPHRPVPRLDNDLALADQLRVVTADLVAAGGADMAAATRVGEVRRAL